MVVDVAEQTVMDEWSKWVWSQQIWYCCCCCVSHCCLHWQCSQWLVLCDNATTKSVDARNDGDAHYVTATRNCDDECCCHARGCGDGDDATTTTRVGDANSTRSKSVSFCALLTNLGNPKQTRMCLRWVYGQTSACRLETPLL